jgi:hypothetical protein
MSALVNRIIASLGLPTDSDAFADAVLDAAFLFEKARGGEPCGWPDEVVDTEVDAGDMARLREAVVGFVERHGYGSWMLSKCQDPSLKPVFIRVLRKNVDGDAGELFQAMIALSNLGEDVFAGRCGMCILDEELNRRLAVGYLGRLPRDRTS